VNPPAGRIVRDRSRKAFADTGITHHQHLRNMARRMAFQPIKAVFDDARGRLRLEVVLIPAEAENQRLDDQEHDQG
jgi:hypothetical protein